MLRTLLIASACGMALVGSARANIVTQTSTVRLGNSQGYGQVYGQLFDPDLGTLTGISYQYAGSIIPSFAGTYGGGTLPSSVSLLPFIVTDYGGSQSQSGLVGESAAITGGNGQFTAMGTPDTFDITGSLPVGAGWEGASPAADSMMMALMDAPMGDSGDFPQLEATAFPNASYPDIISDNAIGSGTFTLTYTYTPADPAPVPEPASLALLGTAVLGVIGVARRRRS